MSHIIFNVLSLYHTNTHNSYKMVFIYYKHTNMSIDIYPILNYSYALIIHMGAPNICKYFFSS